MARNEQQARTTCNRECIIDRPARLCQLLRLCHGSEQEHRQSLLQLPFCGLHPQLLRYQTNECTTAPHEWEPGVLWTESESCPRLDVINREGLGMEVFGSTMKACSILSSTPDLERHRSGHCSCGWHTLSCMLL